ncbi:sensor histidine kinase [Clostridium sediminicola]|uniref:sensor histidine kinase n=1 Tax=Clostridium sediminicola TaxID=3114879 RepID=UPI0031F2362E
MLKPKSFKHKLIIYFSSIIIFLVVVISFTIIKVFSNQIISQSTHIISQKMDLVIKQIDSNISEILSYINPLRNNSYIENLLLNKPSDLEEDTIRTKAISKYLTHYSSDYNSITSIIAIDENMNILDPVYSSENFKSIINNDDEFHDFIVKNYSNKFSKPSSFPIASDNLEDKNRITYYLRFYNKSDYSGLGYLIINLKINTFFNNIKNICMDTFETTYIYDSKGNVIYQLGDIEFDKSIMEDNNAIEINKSMYSIFRRKIDSYPDWTIVGIMPSKTIFGSLNDLIKSVILIGLIFIFIVIVFSLYLSTKLSYPIHKIAESMACFEKGEWPEKIEFKTNDEIETLINGFNKMVYDIKNLIDKVYIEEEEKKALEVAVVQSKLDLLQSQMNPHFIHNTLNTISYIAMKNEDVEVRNLIQNFNLLLRINMSIEKKYITISEEINYLQGYIKLQNYRYDNIIKFLIEAPEDILLYKIPKLLIQPLVENSIYHGISPKDSFGTIKVTFSRIDTNYLRIKIIDDGVGIKKDTLKDLLINRPSLAKKGSNNLSLSNVNKRLEMYFGKESQIKIFSNTGLGTSITFIIPILE